MGEAHVDYNVTPPVPSPADLEKSVSKPGVDYAKRANWLRAAVLGANDGLVSVASLMVGVGAVNQTAKAMVVSGFAGLIAGACSMAIGEYVSVCTQYDIQMAQIKREEASRKKRGIIKEEKHEDENLPSPIQAAGASALAFALGGLLPLLSGGFVNPWAIRVAVVCVVTSLGLVGFGATGGFLGGASVRRSAARVLFGGWFALGFTYGVLRLFGLAFDMEIESSGG
ncbi:hypothetical protein ZOSMA_24G00350 [Zostera marina]|uniref:Vacuolar iron transporter n=1 Tax=Zostera marina TaxID=29655 RepID=A0A0K9PGB0_ZOSMR|nr:hypothetical protein ZOSMA_24G00350 [Zostera marina]